MPLYVWDGRAVVEVPRDRPRAPSVFPSIQRDLPAYRSPLGTGTIEGRAARREDLARGGCRAVEPSERAVMPPEPAWVKDWRAGRGVVRSDPTKE
jgi:hypothetical protein